MTDDATTARLRERLAELEREHVAGEELLVQLRAEQQRVTESLLRIGGAIQVLHELLDAPPAP
jgi:hypothetical protein